MRGYELIEWIKKNNAEDLFIIIEHRDSGGTYHTAEHLEEPALCSFSDKSSGIINNIIFDKENSNERIRAICL